MEEYSDRTPADIARYPMVPIRDVVIFPFTKVAFKIGRPGSVRALEMALASDRTIFLSTQHDATVDEPTPDQIYGVGTIARIRKPQCAMPIRRTWLMRWRRNCELRLKTSRACWNCFRLRRGSLV